MSKVFKVAIIGLDTSHAVATDYMADHALIMKLIIH